MKTLTCLLLLSVLVTGCNRVEHKTQIVPAVKTVEAVSAKVGMTLVFPAEIQPRYESELAFRVSGKILSRNVNLGSHVIQGQVLARLDPADLKLSAAASQAQVASLQADYIFAKSELARYRKLLDQHYVSATAFEVKKNTYAAALARLHAAKAQARVSENRASYSNLQADFDGVITAVNGEPGQIVSAGQPVLKLAKTGALDAVINAAESQIQAVRESKRILVSLWTRPDKKYSGHIREIAGSADIASRTYVVKIQIDNPDSALKLGMTASVAMQGMQSGGDTDTLIPLTALLDDRQHAAVYVLDAKNQIVLRDVHVGQYREHDALITSGLKPGERIIAVGVHKLRAGERVNPLPDGSLFVSDINDHKLNMP